MKKINSIIFVMVVTLLFNTTNAYAQWREPIYIPADELKGTSASYMNMYNGDCGWFSCIKYKNMGWVVIINSNDGIFDYNEGHINDTFCDFVNVIIGFYDGDKLVDKYNGHFIINGNIYDSAMMADFIGDNLPSKIVNHLKTVGKVRIIANQYNRVDFDLTIPMNPNIK